MLSDVRQADTCAVAMLIHVRACFLSLVFCVCCLYFAGLPYTEPFHAKRSAAWPELADLLPALHRSQCRSMPTDGKAFTSIYTSPGLAH